MKLELDLELELLGVVVYQAETTEHDHKVGKFYFAAADESGYAKVWIAEPESEAYDTWEEAAVAGIKWGEEDLAKPELMYPEDTQCPRCDHPGFTDKCQKCGLTQEEVDNGFDQCEEVDDDEEYNIIDELMNERTVDLPEDTKLFPGDDAP